MEIHTSSKTVNLNNSFAGSRRSLLSSGLLTGALVALMSLGLPSTASAATCTTDVNCGRTGTGSSGCTGGDCGTPIVLGGSTQIYYPLVATGTSSPSARATSSQPQPSLFRLFIDPMNLLFGRRE